MHVINNIGAFLAPVIEIIAGPTAAAATTPKTLKRCSTCGAGPEKVRFNKDRSKRDGLNSQCQGCSNASTAKSNAKAKARMAPAGTPIEETCRLVTEINGLPFALEYMGEAGKDRHGDRRVAIAFSDASDTLWVATAREGHLRSGGFGLHSEMLAASHARGDRLVSVEKTGRNARVTYVCGRHGDEFTQWLHLRARGQTGCPSCLAETHAAHPGGIASVFARRAEFEQFLTEIPGAEYARYFGDPALIKIPGSEPCYVAIGIVTLRDGSQVGKVGIAADLRKRYGRHFEVLSMARADAYDAGLLEQYILGALPVTGVVGESDLPFSGGATETFPIEHMPLALKLFEDYLT